MAKAIKAAVDRVRGATRKASKSDATRDTQTGSGSNARSNTKPINLALQGGGAHGAYTWGVLDRLLEDGRLTIEGISGTSAGAMNAVVLADGWARGKADGARERLAEFWKAISRESGIPGASHAVIDSIFGFWKLPGMDRFGMMNAFSQVSSPYTFNPLNINPLRDTLERLVDFEQVHACTDLKLFISATNVRTGKIKLFRGTDVTADAIMASACLPLVFQAVEIDGEAYWDGGYMGNPALYPFFTETSCQDIMLVQINPIFRDEIPTTSNDIAERINEITFNASMLREFRAIDFVNRLLDERRLDQEQYSRNRMHRIDADEALKKFGSSTKMDTSWRFFQQLHDIGRESADEWLEAHFDAIGSHSTLDLREAFS
jgi:NTE family protein